MSHLTGKERSEYVKNTFTRIAAKYDLMNRLMTFGFDIQWRKEMVKYINPLNGEKILDIGCGTGDIAYELEKSSSDTFIVAADFTPSMIWAGKTRNSNSNINWVVADAQNLPFAKDSFEHVTSGFLLRNVPDIEKTLSEKHRVQKSGGRFAFLDTSPIRKNIFYPFIMIHLKIIIPLIGKIISRDEEAYQYLPSSTIAFKSADEIARLIKRAGYAVVDFQYQMFKTIAIHLGRK